MMKNADKYVKLGLIFAAALAIRLIYIKITGPDTLLDMDSPEYLSYANNLLAGNGYTDGRWLAFRPPGYPFFVAGVYYIFGQSVFYLKAVQALLSSFIPVLIYLTGLKLKNERVALGAAVFSCFYFGLYQEPAHILSESVFTFLFTLAVYLALKTDENGFYFPAAGALIGLAAFTRPVGLLLVPVFLLWMIVKFRPNDFIKHSLFLLLGFSAVLAPWWVRNYRVFGTFVPVCLETGFVMRHSHSDPEQLKKLSEFDGLPELERDRKNFSKGLEYFKSYSATRLLKRWTGNFLQFLYPFTPAYDVTYALIFPLWLYGLYALLKTRDKPSWILFSMFVYFPVAAFFFGTARYRHSLGPAFILISFLGLEHLLAGIKDAAGKKKALFPVFGCWAAVNFFLLFYPEQVRTIVKNLAWGLLK